LQYYLNEKKGKNIQINDQEKQHGEMTVVQRPDGILGSHCKMT
jgi:hypothetical protein